MGKSTRYVGMDVHAATIAVAVVEGRGMPRSLGVIENRPEAIRRSLGKLGDASRLGTCCTGSSPSSVCTVRWSLRRWCRPRWATVKTDRRDAEKLARAYR